MKGYKIFGPDFTCRNYKFEDENKVDGPLEICARGFHFCPRAYDCLKYYYYSPNNTYAEVESHGEIQTQDDKVACLELKIVRRLSYEEFGELLTYTIKTPRLECNYIRNKLDGIYKEWHYNGQLRKECKYIEDKVDGIYKTWYQNGQLRKECNYIRNKLDGIYKEWYQDGQLRKERKYIEDKVDGIYKTWYQNGQLRKECNYSNGKRDGI